MGAETRRGIHTVMIRISQTVRHNLQVLPRSGGQTFELRVEWMGCRRYEARTAAAFRASSLLPLLTLPLLGRGPSDGSLIQGPRVHADNFRDQPATGMLPTSQDDANDPTWTFAATSSRSMFCVPAPGRSTLCDITPESGRARNREDFTNVLAKHLAISRCIWRQRTAPVPQHG